MSTSTDWLSEATSLLTAASGPSGAVTATANLLSELLKVAQPLITDDITQRYDQQIKDRLEQLVSILSKVDGDDRADQLNRYFIQLCVDTGTPAVGLGANLSVPVAFVLALAAAALKSIRDEAILTTLTQNAAKGFSSK